jgi:hypothetical protein
MAAKTQAGKCALCLQEKDLRESHISSKFLWKHSGITGEKKSFAVNSPTHPELNEPHRQDGIKEYLLCHDCEQQIGRYETYAARALFHDDGPVKNRPSQHYVWQGLDYTRLKLFQMSILWRMGVSSHPFYAHVNLDKHAEILRTMLLSEDPGEPWQYGSMTALLEYAGEPILGVFSQPLRTKKFGRHVYSYTIAGMHWYQYVTSHQPEQEIQQILLQPSGTWVLFRGELEGIPELKAQVELFRNEHRGAQQDAGGKGG